MSSTKLTWEEAREVCKRESNGDLISMHSPVGQGEIVTARSKLYKKVAILQEKTILHGTLTHPRFEVRNHFLMISMISVITIMSPLVESISDIITITTTRRGYCVLGNKNPEHS